MRAQALAVQQSLIGSVVCSRNCKSSLCSIWSCSRSSYPPYKLSSFLSYQFPMSFATKIPNPLFHQPFLKTVGSHSSASTPERFHFSKPITFQKIPTKLISVVPPASSSQSSSVSLQPVEDLPPKLQEIVKLFQAVEQPKAKYEQLLFYGKNLKPLDAQYKTGENKVQGCVSQVWVRAYLDANKNVIFEADSDSVLTKGLAALLVQGLSGRPVDEIVRVSPDFAVLLGLQQSLTPSRNNGFLNMLKLMQKKALQLYVEAEKTGSLGHDEDASNTAESSNFGVTNDNGNENLKTGLSSEESGGNDSKAVSSGSVILGSRGMRIRERLERDLMPAELDTSVTFLLTDHIHGRLNRHTNLQSRLRQYPGFRIKTISDGLPADHPREGNRYMELFDSLKAKTRPLFKEMLCAYEDSPPGPVTCIISDGILDFTGDVADEVGVPIFFIRTYSPTCLWIFFCLPKLVQSGELPFHGDDDLDEAVKDVPGMETFLRRRDLPEFCRSGNITDPKFKLYTAEGKGLLNSRSRGLILNTFEELDGSILAEIRNVCPNLYAVGPLHAALRTKLKSSETTSSSNSLWPEDRSCLAWLDKQPRKSVMYVSFGSIATLTKQQLMEFWHGLVNSQQRFLWVFRRGKDSPTEIPAELAESTKERGFIVGWAPQEEVLAHPAIGGFLTHCGWNSTIESVSEGVPMVSWPYFLDQQVNSRFVEAVYNVGLDMKDTCDRVVIEKMVRDLMLEKKDEFLQRAEEMAGMARRSVVEGGSSFCNFQRLVNDIKSSSSRVHYP